ncbi:MAG TPA: hypothetical protein VGM88_15595 [Kofleriaceae bacterium]|jgi:hypothetical protein
MNRALLTGFVLSVVAACGGNGSDIAGDHITLVNDSQLDVAALYLAPSDGGDYGDSVLDGDWKPGDSVVIGIDCSTATQYDIELTISDNTECEVHDIDLCTTMMWTLESDTCRSGSGSAQ